MQKVIMTHKELQVIPILQAIRQDLADKIVNLMLEHRTIGMHARHVAKIMDLFGQQANIPEDQKEKLSYVKFLGTIYKHCSTEVTTRVIESEWQRKLWVNKKDQAIPRITFFA